MQLLNTLYVTLADSRLRLDNDALRVMVGDETRLRVPLHHLHGVVCFGHVVLSAPLMHRLAEDAIALVLLDDSGRFKARLEGPQGGNVLLRLAHHRAFEDAAFTLALARTVVTGKLRNQRAVLLRGAREAKLPQDQAALDRIALNIAASLRALPAADSLDTVRGTEGEAARGYFEGLNLLVRADLRCAFAMDGRSRRRRETVSTPCCRSCTRCGQTTAAALAKPLASTLSLDFCTRCGPAGHRLRSTWWRNSDRGPTAWHCRLSTAARSPQTISWSAKATPAKSWSWHFRSASRKL